MKTDHDLIIEMHTDIKWIKEDAERRNGLFFNHLEESNKYRTRIDRLYHLPKIVITLILILSSVFVKLYLNK